MKYFNNESEFAVLNRMVGNLGNLLTLHAEQSYAGNLRNLASTLFSAHWKRLGWKVSC